MTKRSPLKDFKTSPEIIRPAVMPQVRFSLSLRNVEDLPHERGIDVSHGTVRLPTCWNPDRKISEQPQPRNVIRCTASRLNSSL